MRPGQTATWWTRFPAARRKRVPLKWVPLRSEVRCELCRDTRDALSGRLCRRCYTNRASLRCVVKIVLRLGQAPDPDHPDRPAFDYHAERLLASLRRG